MRKISALQVLVFSLLLTLIGAATIATTYLISPFLDWGGFHAILVVVLGVVLLYVYALAAFRMYLTAFPLRAGEIAEGSGQEFVYHIYLMFLLALFHPIIRGAFVPVPLMRVFYQVMGAKLGPNTYSSGILWDPLFISIGANTIIGHGALIIPHIIEGRRLAFYPVTIGDNVTIGAYATLLAGVTIGDGAMVSVGAVVTKGTQVGPSEVWAGMPARLHSKRGAEEAASSRRSDIVG